MIYFPQGSAYKLVGSKRVAVESIHASDQDDCCYLDCCCGAIRLKDRVTGKFVVLALEDGVLVPYDRDEFVCNNGKVASSKKK